jgi:hypothetical protein
MATPPNFKTKNTCFNCEHSDGEKNQDLKINCLLYSEKVKVDGLCDSYTGRVTPISYDIRPYEVCYTCLRYVPGPPISCSKWTGAVIVPVGVCDDWKKP